ncbi:uncharacterized protein LOC134821944 [Bolinopsis microptera]|uniref:uncharacterized protein LOC134821944 n=1 Tax=Bolinopsis microptera TaxID=2820187 RepID=UPI003079DFFD
MGMKKPPVNKYEEIPMDRKIQMQLSRQETIDTTLLAPPPPDTNLWLALFIISLSGFVIGLVGLLSPNYMSGDIDVGPYKATIKSFLSLDRDVPDVLKMADFGLFRFCFSEDFMEIITKAMEFGDGEMPENEGGMKLDFSKRCHKVIETENQPQHMKDTTRTGKILMFMGLSSVLITWMFVILVLVAGRHLSKVITGISASVSVTFLVSSLLVSMTLRPMTKDYLNLEIMKSVRTSVENMGINIDLIEKLGGLKFTQIQPVNVEPGFSGFLIVTSAVLLMVVGITALLKTRSHKPG